LIKATAIAFNMQFLQGISSRVNAQGLIGCSGGRKVASAGLRVSFATRQCNCHGLYNADMQGVTQQGLVAQGAVG
jgi:hypothetical protein